MKRRDCRCRFAIEPLEMRLVPSGSVPANVIGTSTAAVSRPREVSQTSVQVAPKNITPQKHGTIFGVFVQPTSGSQLQPQIVAVRGSTGKALPVQYGRPFRSGTSDEAVAFFKNTTAGPLTIEVTGAHQSTGSYLVQTTLAGDVNGDGTVNFADLQAFAPSYSSQQGEHNYNPAADFNQNGMINLYDAKALLHNMAPLTPKLPLATRLTLAPQDQIHYSGPTVLGAATFQKVVTILGHTTPGSLVIEDNNTSRLPGGTQAYKFTGPAVATDANGFFSVTSTNTSGLNNNDFLILDPFGQQMVIDFPIFWIPYATGRGVPK
ncbi:MAG TPA: dockerin type I domain-containing protein [Isosphaeraceae bacterium]|nr:dockerin type I domain-containing protein [Isosphaeraceae bacterium]